MVEINNQRKAFLDMLAWSEELIPTSKTEIAGYTGGELHDYLITLKLATNPKLKSTGAGRYQLLSRWWDVTASSLA